MNIGSIATAMVTPFRSDGSINFEQAELLIEHLLATGTDSLVITGTTGESPTLSTEEKLSLLKFVVEKVNNRVPVIAGTGSNSTIASIDLSIKAEALGVNGLMIVTPYYNKPNQRGLIAHFTAIANATTLPIVVYNIPSRSVINMELETMVTLSQIPSIKFLKEANGNLEQMTRILSETKGNLEVYSGDDSLTLPLLAIGGSGIISVASHIVGNEMHEMIEAFRTGNHKEASRIHQSLLPLIQALFKHPNPIVVKYALSKVGINAGSLRLPLVQMAESEKREFDVVWEQYLNTK
ncbi:4-hydroxy-tetrahydrodipicolinate synthase [Psychrobacillus psychrodurans]|uniref:4-hydroxy-tetrahydrodipicolinate synthase n=1 Tax=Psychrobacillus psychrodurans TaxID=126157 RepID=UPI0008E1518C|nr:4-hydroxy-tetrahydrodipicolinate synthase [Psychrobacillus psychrodurans]MCZ8539590.1 4-hydroxy-tetrahydrodipicolinate synthase [Psychrobacillus psychrodurans]SFM42339.1 4-hydroxy-tetrahydrodipicolinate synthase [Psychrobacillus psychrodurans]